MLRRTTSYTLLKGYGLVLCMFFINVKQTFSLFLSSDRDSEDYIEEMKTERSFCLAWCCRCRRGRILMCFASHLDSNTVT